jgi:YbgC/YbaW family acyl-CoA thioester hydrolase
MAERFTWHRLVTFAETDLAGVMHFANYFRWMEECEHAFWRSLGRSVVHLAGPETISWPRVSVSCDYLAPLKFEDRAELHLGVAALSERSVTFEVDFHRNGRRVAHGTTTAVCCIMDKEGFRAIRIPNEIRAALAGFVITDTSPAATAPPSN